ncbi:SH3 domain-containing protein [Thermocoleostomius sinensis]|uniref:SH3 domain-containing protein n=1 Tax=Thermocoleostomius sinensis A174 TaxID=2016057 RepID=A0A9E9C9D7_9CYAN|nr:SH3 domain-containing protein [Thermocoleostomius sinensis]WAL61458.1 SH3 domain-containing protein [Thermocoleostomius sinensis A174]
MKNFKRSIQLFSATAALVAMTVVSTSTMVQAQAITPELEAQAEEACINKARADGFELSEVVDIAAVDADTVNVVLNLTRDGQLFKLTCGYTASNQTVTTTNASRTYAPWINPWLGILLPLLVGLPLLLWWAAGRREDRDRVVTRERTYIGERSEAIVRTSADGINVHAGPTSTSRVTGNLRNGQRIVLSGRYDNDWVELENGGWVPVRFVETATRYVN